LAGWSLDALAARAGCAKSYLWAVERGRKGPPSEALIGRIESALGVAPGEMAAAARWERTPGVVRRDIESLRERSRASQRLAGMLGAGVRAGSLDDLYKSGALHALIGRLDPDFAGGGGGGGGGAVMQSVAAALPVEIPVINKVTAGYPAGFTDLGYPARVADEYIRSPDVHDPDAFAARVVGDSMEPDYRAGDIVVFSPAVEVTNGMDCFVRLEPDDESTFKRVFFEGEAGAEIIRIEAINRKYEPRVLPRERVAGLYAGVSVTRPIGRG
jgi:SOS-response transcriptional repressor LexA